MCPAYGEQYAPVQSRTPPPPPPPPFLLRFYRVAHNWRLTLSCSISGHAQASAGPSRLLAGRVHDMVALHNGIVFHVRE